MPKADIAILTVIPEEYEALIASLSAYGCKTEHDPGTSTAPNQFGWVTGEVRGNRDQRYRVVVGMVTQPGPARMTSAISATLTRYKPQYVLVVGIAGGFPQDGLMKGDVVISSVIYDYDYGKVATSFQPRMDFTYQPDQTLLTSAVSLHARDKSWAERDKHLRPDGSDAVPKLLPGAVASGGKVVDDAGNDFFAAVLEAWPRLLAVEMEGAGAAAAIETAKAAKQNVGFLMVRAISDMPKLGADNQSTDASPAGNKAERDKWKKYAATTAANFTIHWISQAWPLAPTAEDAVKVRAQSDASLKALSRVATIRIGDAEVHVPRRSIEALVGAAQSENLVLVGEPGAGKSIGLFSLAQLLTEQGGEVVILDVQRVQAESAGQLRSELMLSQDLLDVLKAWPGEVPAYLLIDAMDAARSESVARTFFDLLSALISEPNRRWKVVVSVRKFDLRYNEELKRLFRGSPPTEFVDPEFAGLRHVNMPALDDSELDLVAQRLFPIQSLIVAASTDFRSLLKVPFNLRLAAELLDAGTQLTDLTPIRTQIQLLDQFWRARVIGKDAHGDARESVAFAAAMQMANSRSLTIARSVVSKDPAASDALHGLLRVNVLAEWSVPDITVPDRYTLTFSHNILFDYAAALALFGSSTAALLKQLAATPDLVLAIRPSAVFQFQRIWLATNDHRDFWRSVLDAVQISGLPRISGLIGPSVAVDFAREISDFEGLFAALEGSNSRDREAAEEVVRHIAGALLAKNTPLTGPAAGPWCAWMERVSVSVTAQTAGPLRALLWRWLDEA